MVNLFSLRGCNFLNKDVRLDEKLMKELVMCGLVTYFGAREVKDNYFPLEREMSTMDAPARVGCPGGPVM